MVPIKTNESNTCYLGPTPEVADLHCRIEEGCNTFSVWEFTQEEREQIAKGANLRLGLHGLRPIPPLTLCVVPNDGPWQRVAAKCDVCGKGNEHHVHLSGPGTHAYRSRKN